LRIASLARGFALLLPLSVLTGCALQAGEPHRPPTQGSFFIPFGSQSEPAQEEADNASARTFQAAGPAETALAEIPDAPALAHALRALVALDADKVRRAPDMASAVGAHLPRYRLRQGATLRVGASSDADTVTEVEAGLVVILVAVEGGWQQLYVPSRHALGWRRRSAETP